jgi:methylglutaconyl-CoA hydratase
MLTGRVFDTREAVQLGFINHTWPDGDFHAGVRNMLEVVLTGGTLAQQKIKSYLNVLPGIVLDESLVEQTARLIAEVRVSAEAKEGIKAFLQQRSNRVTDKHQN